MITYSLCPCCGAATIKHVLTVKDFTVSQEFFEIWECATCSFRFTQNAPGPEQIGAYYQSDNYISHTDTRKGLINSLYHKVRKRTLKGKLELIKKQTGLDTGVLIDIGAGTGAFLAAMKDAGWYVQGLEPDSGSRKRAFDNYGIALQSSEELYQLPSGLADAITMWHVLEHVHELHAYITEIKRVLKPGGILFIAVPNYTSYDGAFYRRHWAAYDVPRHLYHFSPSSMSKLLQNHSLQLITQKPMWYDSFYVSMLSEQYKRGKSGYISAIFNGLLSDIKTIFNTRKCSSLIYIIRK